MALRYWRCSALRLCVSVFEWKENKHPALHACNEFLHLTHLSGGGQRGSVLQQHGSNILVSFAGRQVKGGVAWGGGSVGRGAALQQLLDDVDFPQPTGDVQRCLVILRRRKEDKVTLLAQYCIIVCFLSPAQWLITSLVFSPWTWSPPWLRSWAGIGLRLPGLPWLPCGELSRLSERHRKKKKSSAGAFHTQRCGIWTHRRSNYSFSRPLPLRDRQSGLSVFPSHWKTVPHPAQNRNLISMIHIFDLASALLALTDAILTIYPGLGLAIRIVLACIPRG